MTVTLPRLLGATGCTQPVRHKLGLLLTGGVPPVAPRTRTPFQRRTRSTRFALPTLLCAHTFPAQVIARARTLMQAESRSLEALILESLRHLIQISIIDY